VTPELDVGSEASSELLGLFFYSFGRLKDNAFVLAMVVQRLQRIHETLRHFLLASLLGKAHILCLRLRETHWHLGLVDFLSVRVTIGNVFKCLFELFALDPESEAYLGDVIIEDGYESLLLLAIFAQILDQLLRRGLIGVPGDAPDST